MDTEVSGNIEIGGKTESIERKRDIIKKAACGIEYIVMGLESQEHIHYAMPLRNMIYDGLGYLKEYKAMKREVKNFKSADEFLSRMCREDKLHPIITLTVYYGEKPWDGPKTLKDMVFKMPAEIERVFSDYTMNLIQIRDSGKYVFHNDEVRAAFEISRNIFEGNIDEIVKKYCYVPLGKEVWNFVGMVTDARLLLAERYDKESDNMCEALERWAAEKIKQAEQVAAEGMKKGIEQDRRCIVKNMFKYGLSWEKIAEMTGLSGEEVKALRDYAEEDCH